ncbi:TIGR02679 family protein [Actinokineospora auranticolor]|nr:TIGR02679 family protein [Actinokineospora auranticolor]
MNSELPRDLVPVWESVHHRLSSGRAVARIRLGPLSPAQQSALADLLGADRLPGPTPSVPLNDLDTAIRAATGRTTSEFVTDLLGPLANRAQRRDDVADLWAWLAAHPVVTAQPALHDWTRAVRQAGLVNGSIAQTRTRLDAVLRVLDHLPAPGTPLPALADELLHDPHALDDGTAHSTLVLRALAAIHTVDPPNDAQARRDLWAKAGVADDELSSTVLAAGLRPTDEHLTATLLRACADAGQAACLTLGHLRAAADLNGPPRTVCTVENPTVLALALTRFGRDCPPIVCVSGWPNGAAIRLLRLLADAGHTLRYHGDFDGEGLRIAAHVMARTGAVPWRMTTADYLAAVGPTGPPVGRVTDAPWDPGLAAALTARGVAVPEERVATVLLDEIDAG